MIKELKKVHKNKASCWYNSFARKVGFFHLVDIDRVLKTIQVLKNIELVVWVSSIITEQKMKFSFKDFFSKFDQTAVSCGYGHTYRRIPSQPTQRCRKDVVKTSYFRSQRRLRLVWNASRDDLFLRRRQDVFQEMS